MTLRPLQQSFIEEIRAAFRSHRRVLGVAATGFGKTVCFSYIAKNAAERGNRTLILTHREELIRQIEGTLSRWNATADVRSIQTVARRLSSTPKPDLIIVDECHHSGAETWNRVLSHWPDVKILGVTATPARLDGKGLGDQFDYMVLGPDAWKLIAEGWLVRPRYFVPPTQTDLSDVSITGGDYARGELAAAVDRPSITGDAVEHYRKRCDGVSAIAFCVSREHAAHVTEAFVAGGIAAEIFHGGIPDRQVVMGRFRDGQTKVLVTVDLVGEGLDVPSVGAVLLLRPTQSLCLHLQQIGRGLRTSEGKTECVVLDHAGNTFRHGLAEWPREWTLEGRKRAKRGVDEFPDIAIKRCPSCFAVCAGGVSECPECGVAMVEARPAREREGILEEVETSVCPRCGSPTVRGVRCGGCTRNEKAEEAACRTKEDFFALAKRRGYKPYWAKLRWDFRNKRRVAKV